MNGCCLEHDPWNPNGCRGCERVEELSKDKPRDQVIFWRMNFLLSRYLSSADVNPFELGIKYFKNKNYKFARSYIYKSLLIFKQTSKRINVLSINKWNRNEWDIHLCPAMLLLYAAKCNLELNKYISCISDLNQIINICVLLIPNKASYIYIKTHETSYFLHQASKIRAEIYKMMGNTAKSLSDYFSAKHCGEEIKQLNQHKHPTKYSFVTCNSNTLQMVDFAKQNNGWIKVLPINSNMILPSKFGHHMIEYDGKLYVFGGQSMVPNKTEPIFIEIIIHKNNRNKYKYTMKSLLFPRTMRQYLFGKMSLNDIQRIHQSQAVTVNKWRHYMIIFGGDNYPFFNIIKYDLKHKKWYKMNTNLDFKNHRKKSSIFHCEAISHHSAITMNNKLYIFGGYIDFKGSQNVENNALTCFDLINQCWKICGNNNNSNIKDITVNPRIVGIYDKPEQRYDHIMWCDKRNNSIYVGFGNYDRNDAKHLILPQQRSDIWRYDTIKCRWIYNETLNGNVPIERSESGFCSTSTDFYLFGGYNAHIIHSQSTASYNGFVYLADFFRFNFKSQCWKLIQSEIFPEYRALSTMSYFNINNENLMCLYGGYQSSNLHTSDFNDLWIFNLDKVKKRKLKKSKNKTMKQCEFCGKNNLQIKLWKCCGMNCVCRYCSYRCQKRHWKRIHRQFCIK